MNTGQCFPWPRCLKIYYSWMEKGSSLDPVGRTELTPRRATGIKQRTKKITNQILQGVRQVLVC